jgi:hypothetical protein
MVCPGTSTEINKIRSRTRDQGPPRGTTAIINTNCPNHTPIGPGGVFMSDAALLAGLSPSSPGPPQIIREAPYANVGPNLPAPGVRHAAIVRGIVAWLPVLFLYGIGVYLWYVLCIMFCCTLPGSDDRASICPIALIIALDALPVRLLTPLISPNAA